MESIPSVDKFENLEQVVACFQEWANEQNQIHPPAEGGYEYDIKMFVPEWKSQSAPSRIDDKTFGGMENGYAWRFIANDRRALERKHFQESMERILGT